jgi:molecular chaperone GrpE
VEKDETMESGSDERVIPINNYSADSEIDSSASGAEGETPPHGDRGESGVSELDELKAKVVELDEQRLLSLADFDNYKKRMARQFEDVVRTANDRLLCQILDVTDNFERALQHAGDGSDAVAQRKGMELIYNQLMDVLRQYQLEPIPALGQPFDTNLHEALLHVESDTYDDGIVSQEIVRGYRIGDRVIRFAKVGVSKGKPKSE